ncbi:Glyoxalase/bleomycin resistance/extradiol dioxygenase family protein [Flavobacterium sp. 9AF]|uniref:VOC family protein n=1 Tax=Flavobacterium sp. 9AF TaxID=2653142 RepID=UPI0012F470A8|nr:VOC family protein [Flavobacterium sp. 9AF]VXB90389.1 Glyoxalase/bleomycin resistance/extradiol dioxygenase family protein [Flavobacterium sp. 9AF]
MKNKILGLRTVIYKISPAHLQEAKAWYSKVFQTQPYFDAPYYIGFNIGGYELGLQPEELKSEKTPNVSCYWGVENVEETYHFFIANGATGFEVPENVGGEIVVATVKDPWNNLIGLIYNPEFQL